MNACGQCLQPTYGESMRASRQYACPTIRILIQKCSAVRLPILCSLFTAPEHGFGHLSMQSAVHNAVMRSSLWGLHVVSMTHTQPEPMPNVQPWCAWHPTGLIGSCCSHFPTWLPGRPSWTSTRASGPAPHLVTCSRSWHACVWGTVAQT